MHVGSIPTSHTNLSKGNIMEIIVEIRTVYGNTAFYPVCEKAKLFASIAGTKTLTANVLVTIGALGIGVVLDNKSYEQNAKQFLAKRI